MTLHHLTTNTGHVALTERADVADDVIALLRPLVDAGAGQIPGPVAWWLAMDRPHAGWARYHITHDLDAAPYVTCVGCWDDDDSAAAWRRTEQPGPPPPVPWLAIETLPTILRLSPEAVGMLGDLERCIFWALAAGDADPR